MEFFNINKKAIAYGFKMEKIRANQQESNWS